MLTKARIATAAGLAALATTAVLAPSSGAQKYNTPKPITIEMVQKGRTFAFTGPSKVAKGSKITFINRTKVQKGGPHTASVVDPALLPKTKAEMMACAGEEGFGGLCGAIAKAHKVDLKTFKVAKPDVDLKKKGWDAAFGKKGDTWYSETLDEEETRVVSAKAGTTLTFFCAVHPEMVKKIKVTK